ncbi:MAG: zinc ribbon domain-containing protein [Eubacterium sp.]|nr:zinc ribbon domain-containing protein [Eubacterium sp.]
MDILKFEYIYREYATTNPPRSLCTAYALQNFTDSSVELNYYRYNNGDENEVTYTITGDRFSEIMRIINDGKVVEEIERQTPEQRNPQFMQMCGGSTTTGVNITKANGEELHTQSIPNSSYELSQLLQALVREMQNPPKTQDNWYCSNCGAPNNGGNFCSNCGTPRTR